MEKAELGFEFLLRLIQNKLIWVGLEVTYVCNAKCKFCDIPSRQKTLEESPESYRRLLLPLKPFAVAITGGEPLLRKDLERIAEEVKSLPTPLVIVNTNGRLLTEDRYYSLQDYVDVFTVSLDFPDGRHDEYREVDGLYSHLATLIPKLSGNGSDDVVLNSIIMDQNLKDIPSLVQLAESWGVKINFNLYSSTKTSKTKFSVKKERIRELRKMVDFLKQQKIVINSNEYLENVVKFVMDGGLPGCQAGRRFLWVTPNGRYKPCVDKDVTGNLSILKEFYRDNKCGSCYYTCRGNPELRSIKSGLHFLRIV